MVGRIAHNLCVGRQVQRCPDFWIKESKHLAVILNDCCDRAEVLGEATPAGESRRILHPINRLVGSCVHRPQQRAKSRHWFPNHNNAIARKIVIAVVITMPVAIGRLHTASQCRRSRSRYKSKAFSVRHFVESFHATAYLMMTTPEPPSPAVFDEKF